MGAVSILALNTCQRVKARVRKHALKVVDSVSRVQEKRGLMLTFDHDAVKSKYGIKSFIVSSLR
jgi:hypothetical protein